MTKKRDDDWDDGRTIADMSGVETPNLLLPRRHKRSGDSTQGEPIGKRESRSYIFGALLAGLFIAGIFIAAGALVIWLMVTFWH